MALSPSFSGRTKEGRSAFRPFNPNTLNVSPPANDAALPAHLPEVSPPTGLKLRLHTIGIDCRRKSMGLSENGSSNPATPKTGDISHPVKDELLMALTQAKIKPLKTRASVNLFESKGAGDRPGTPSKVAARRTLRDVVNDMSQFADCSSATNTPKAPPLDDDENLLEPRKSLAAPAGEDATPLPPLSDSCLEAVKKQAPRSRLCNSSSAAAANDKTPSEAQPVAAQSEDGVLPDRAHPAAESTGRRDTIDLRRRAVARMAAVRFLQQLRAAKAHRDAEAAAARNAGSSGTSLEENDKPIAACSKSPGPREKDIERVWTAAVKLFQARHAMQQSTMTGSLRKRTLSSASPNIPISQSTKVRKVWTGANKLTAFNLGNVQEAELRKALLISQLHRATAN
mmetsp:Transcript_2005/g.5913  ORF Transcript_2005/g.5913 Transcript_2005/m.5913 type:complete len:398 (-) Transcript_2005:311-1504(-)